jgi:hypothetical protein
MKTLKVLALALCLLVSGIIAKADTKPSAATLSKEYALTTYIDLVEHGKLDGVKYIFNANTKFSMLRGDQVVSYTRTEMLASFKQNKGIEQNCTVNTTEIESKNDTSVIRVDMQYKDFVRRNYVTIANTKKGWKITEVYTVFK